MPKLLRGIVFSGLGEGARYVELYSREIEIILGFKPYPGTLNLRLDTCINEILKDTNPIIISPPRRDLGSVMAYRGYIKDIYVLVLKPSISRYDCRVVEIVSRENLRERFSLRDGDVIEVILIN